MTEQEQEQARALTLTALNKLARDTSTGFTGRVTAVMISAIGDHVALIERDGADGIQREWFDMKRVEVKAE